MTVMNRTEEIEVLLVKPNEHPQRVVIPHALESLQECVGGDIEVICPYSDLVGLVCNEVGKLNNLPLNRYLTTEQGQIYDFVFGNFLIVGLTEDTFGSLSPELMEKYENMFLEQEKFIERLYNFYVSEDDLYSIGIDMNDYFVEQDNEQEV